MEKLKAIIVEDEQSGIDNLIYKLTHNCPGVEVIASCKTSDLAIHTIPNLKPDIVFMDIMLDNMSGFDVLNRLEILSFELIFTTSYNQYAIQAIKANAIDYLLKPIDEKELATAVTKAWQRIKERRIPLSRIALPIKNGLRFIPVDHILYCEADSNYTKFFLTSGKSILVVRTLKEVCELLSHRTFFRIHSGYLINLDHVNSYTRIDGGLVVMENGTKLKVARGRREDFLNLFRQRSPI